VAAQASPSATAVAGGAATIDAPASVGGGSQFEIAWTGPAALGDYVTIVVKGATKWTTEPYFYTSNPSPGKLVAPTTAGDYELWYVSGVNDAITARRPITVNPLTIMLTSRYSVSAGSPFKVGWTGPNGPNDYVTIVAVGTAKWTTEVYFYTHTANPGSLVAPIKPGAYELWYVTGDGKIMGHGPITITPFAITLHAPASVAKGSKFRVMWTGPNGPSDYITIVPAGSKVGTYLTFAYTAQGSPATITAPAQAGKYEIWYASDRVDGTFASIPIEVK
jgi:Ca-activated chloride channel family protein